jgi:hypothetical protein
MFKTQNPTGRPLLFSSPAELETKINEYFDSITIHRKTTDAITGEERTYTEYLEPPTVSGLSLHLNTSRRVLLDYENSDTHRNIPDEETKRQYSSLVTRAKARVEAFAEQSLYTSKSANGPIFVLKNNFSGWRDETVVCNEPAKTDGVDLSKLSNDELSIMRDLMRKATAESQGGEGAER